MIHRMTDARTGAEIARLSQYGVRNRAAALVVPVG
jgi:hypothetical protein